MGLGRYLFGLLILWSAAFASCILLVRDSVADLEYELAGASAVSPAPISSIIFGAGGSGNLGDGWASQNPHGKGAPSSGDNSSDDRPNPVRVADDTVVYFHLEDQVAETSGPTATQTIGVVGVWNAPDSSKDAFLYSGSYRSLNESIFTTPTNAEALGLNRHGQVVGYIEDRRSSPYSEAPVQWSSFQTCGPNNPQCPAPSIVRAISAGETFRLFGINDAGLIGGLNTTGAATIILYDPTRPANWIEVATNVPSWSKVSVNNSGKVAGTLLRNGSSFAFVCQYNSGSCALPSSANDLPRPPGAARIIARGLSSSGRLIITSSLSESPQTPARSWMCDLAQSDPPFRCQGDSFKELLGLVSAGTQSNLVRAVADDGTMYGSARDADGLIKAVAWGPNTDGNGAFHPRRIQDQVRPGQLPEGSVLTSVNSVSSVGGIISGVLRKPDNRFYAYVLRPALGAGRAYGDMDCNSRVEVLDINGFVLALSDPSEYARQYPLCNILAADVNNDAVINVLDIQAFVDLIRAQ